MIRYVAIGALMGGLVLLGVHDIAAGLYKTGVSSILLAGVNGLLLA